MKNLFLPQILKRSTQTFILMLSLFISSCSDDEKLDYTKLTPDYCTDTELDCSSYWPSIEVGDYWLDDAGYRQEVTGTTVLDAKTYFEMSIFDPSNVLEVVWYERYEGSQHFFKLDAATEEELMADFSGDLNEEWETPYFDGGTTTVKLESKTASITINGVTFSDAFIFGRTYSDYPPAYIPIMYLPGIGLVDQKNFQNGVLQENFTFHIVEFKINGKVYKIE